MQKRRLPLLIKKKDKYINFNQENYDMIIVTGITGSGKSYISKQLSEKYKIPVISFDIIYGYEKEREKNDLETKLLNEFYKQYKDYRNLEQLAKQKKLSLSKLKQIDNQFFDFVLTYIKEHHLKIIFDGTYFYTNIDYDKYKNQRIVIKMTPFILTLIQLNKRNIRRVRPNETKLHQIKRNIKFTLKNMKQWYQTFNQYLTKIDSHNG